MKVAAYRTRTTKFQGTVWPPMVSGILGSAKNANPALSVVPSVLNFPFSLLPTKLVGLARSAGSAVGFPSGSRTSLLSLPRME